MKKKAVLDYTFDEEMESGDQPYIMNFYGQNSELVQV
jgi:hypothetical protein